MNDLESSKELAKAIDYAMAECFEADFDKVIGVFDEIESRFIEKLKERNDLHLEIRRRIAEVKFKLLYSRESISLLKKEGLYQEVKELGYTNIYAQATIEIFYAMCCELHSDFEKAKSTILTLNNALERAEEETPEAKEFFENRKNYCTAFLKRIENMNQ